MGILREISSIVVAATLAVTPLGDLNVESMKNIPQTNKETEIVRQVVYRNVVELPQIDTSFKTFMDYRAITDTSSVQWELQQMAYTDENGLRKIDNCYCVAVGSGIVDEVGSKLKICLENGNEFYAIVADQKADIHTDNTNKYRYVSEGRGNVIEFIVNQDCIPEIVRVMGDVSHMPNKCFSGEILEIEVM